jgi:hypothetical protein
LRPVVGGGVVPVRRPPERCEPPLPPPRSDSDGRANIHERRPGQCSRSCRPGCSQRKVGRRRQPADFTWARPAGGDDEARRPPLMRAASHVSRALNKRRPAARVQVGHRHDLARIDHSRARSAGRRHTNSAPPPARPTVGRRVTFKTHHSATSWARAPPPKTIDSLAYWPSDCQLPKATQLGIAATAKCACDLLLCRGRARAPPPPPATPTAPTAACNARSASPNRELVCRAAANPMMRSILAPARPFAFAARRSASI